MRLAISNIAWDVSEDEAVARMLQLHAVDAIDVAPSKYFPDPAKASDEDIVRVKTWWADQGIEITGMQSLLFGTEGLNLFAPMDVQNAMLAHLMGVCRIGAGLGATRLVFGSPRSRDRSSMTDQEAMDVAVPFFRRLGDIAESYGVTICLEPNPPCYGANFMTSGEDTAQVVKQVSHRAIKMQLDTGAITINGEDPGLWVAKYAPLIGHIHASEPDLLPLGDGGTEHDKVNMVLRHRLPNHIVTIEMLATTTEPHLVAIDRAVRVAIKSYRPVLGVVQ